MPRFTPAIIGIIIGMTLTIQTSAYGEATEGVFFQAGLLYSTRNIESTSNDGSSSKSTIATTNLNAVGGYGVGNGLALGLKYYNEVNENGWQLTADSKSDPISETTALGPMLGFRMGNLAVFASYLAIQTPEKISKSQKYAGGSGYIVDLMYMIDMGGWAFGPQFSIINFEYAKFYLNGVESQDDRDLKEQFLYPYFSFLIHL